MIQFKMNSFKTQGHHCAYTLFTLLPVTQHRDTHTSVFWRNLLPPSSLFSTLEMENMGFSKKVDISTTQKTLM